MKNRRLKFIFLAVVIILLIPLIAMQFTNEVHWNLADFVVAGILLLCAGFIFDLILRKTQNTKSRIIISIILLIALLLIWIELAVGVFGSPFAGS